MKLKADAGEVSVAESLRDRGAVRVLVPSFDRPTSREGRGVGCDRVVATDLEGLGEAFKNSFRAVVDLRSSPMKDLLAEPESSPRLLDKGLGAEADPKDGELGRRLGDGLKEAACFRGSAGTGREDEDPGRSRKDLRRIGPVAAGGPGGKAKATEDLLQVEDEAVSIV